MHWNEKIELLKQRFDTTQFSVPVRDRKQILRKIESKFIDRPENYHSSNPFNDRFCNWWMHFTSGLNFTLDQNESIPAFLTNHLDAGEWFWIAAEFPDGILIYKSKLQPLIELITIGQTWTHTFHIIHLKFDFLVSLQMEGECIKIKSTKDLNTRQFLKLKNV